MRKTAMWSGAASVATGVRVHLCTLLFLVLRGAMTMADTIFALLSLSLSTTTTSSQARLKLKLKPRAGVPTKPRSFARRLHGLISAGRGAGAGRDSQTGGWIVRTSAAGPWMSLSWLSTWASWSGEFIMSGGRRRLLAALGDGDGDRERDVDVEADAGRRADALGCGEVGREHAMGLPTYSSTDLGLSRAYIHPHRSRRAAEPEGTLGKITECDLLMPVARTYQVGDRVHGGRWGGIGFKAFDFDKKSRTREDLSQSEQNIFGMKQGGEHLTVLDANPGVLRGANIETTANDDIPGDFSISSSRPITAYIAGPALDSTWDNESPSSYSRMEFAQHAQSKASGNGGGTLTAELVPGATRMDSDTGTTISKVDSDALGPAQSLRTRFSGASKAVVISGPHLGDDDARAISLDSRGVSGPAQTCESMEIQKALSTLSFWTPAPSVRVTVSAPVRRKRRRHRRANKGSEVETLAMKAELGDTMVLIQTNPVTPTKGQGESGGGKEMLNLVPARTRRKALQEVVQNIL